jgi:hypothetical protein
VLDDGEMNFPEVETDSSTEKSSEKTKNKQSIKPERTLFPTTRALVDKILVLRESDDEKQKAYLIGLFEEAKKYSENVEYYENIDRDGCITIIVFLLCALGILGSLVIGVHTIGLSVQAAFDPELGFIEQADTIANHGIVALALFGGSFTIGSMLENANQRANEMSTGAPYTHQEADDLEKKIMGYSVLLELIDADPEKQPDVDVVTRAVRAVQRPLEKAAERLAAQQAEAEENKRLENEKQAELQKEIEERNRQKEEQTQYLDSLANEAEDKYSQKS